MLADLSRCVHLREVWFHFLEIHDADRWVTDAFPTIMRLARNLAIVALDEVLLVLIPEIGTAIASLKSLRTLYFHGAGSETANLLQAIDSPIQNVHLSLTPMAIWPAYLNPDLAHVLLPIRETLETANIVGAQWSRETAVTLPKLSTLQLRTKQLMDTSLLATMTPNLKNLSLDNYRHSVVVESMVEDARVANYDSQIEGICWPLLESATMSITSLYTFAPRCRIHDLTIRTVRPKDLNFSRYSAALELAQPTFLRFDLGQHDASELVGLLNRTPSSVTHVYARLQAVRCLEDRAENFIDMQCAALYPFGPRRLWDADLQAYAPAQTLTHLSLTICKFFLIKPGVSSADVDREITPAHLEDQSLVRDLARLIFSLRYLHLNIDEGQPPDERTYDTFWKIGRTPEVRLKRLSSREGANLFVLDRPSPMHTWTHQRHRDWASARGFFW